MNRISYSLPTLPAPANMPGWALQMTIATQAVMDAQYLHGPGGLDNFYDQAEQWTATETMKRGSNRAYVPEPFRMAIPRRQVVSYDESGNMGSYLAEPDPNIHTPELLPLPPEQPAPPTFGGTHPPVDPTQMLAAVMAKLVAIEAKIEQVLAKK